MRKVILYIAASLDGYIAMPDGKVDWLHDRDFSIPDEDYGYNDFYQSIDTTLMGSKTYNEILGYDIPFPYQGKANYVFTRSNKSDNEDVKFINGDIIAFVRDMPFTSDKDIWLIGGGEINSLFIEHSLIDRLILTLIPITLGDGILLFPNHSGVHKFTLIGTQSYKSGLCQLTYDLKA